MVQWIPDRLILLRIVGDDEDCHIGEMMQKILSLFGTRPEAIKMAPVVKALEPMSHAHNPYGDGMAAERIVAALMH